MKYLIIAFLVLIACPVFASERVSNLTGETYEILSDMSDADAIAELRVKDFPLFKDCRDGKIKENCSRQDPWRFESRKTWQDCRDGKDISDIIDHLDCSQNTYEEFLDFKVKEKKEAILDRETKALEEISLVEKNKQLERKVIEIQEMLNISTSTDGSGNKKNAANYGVVDTVIEQVSNGIKFIQDFFVNQVVATIGLFDRVITKWFETDNLKINQGLELTDEATGELYCVRISRGEWKKTMGACDVSNKQSSGGQTEDTVVNPVQPAMQGDVPSSGNEPTQDAEPSIEPVVPIAPLPLLEDSALPEPESDIEPAIAPIPEGETPAI